MLQVLVTNLSPAEARAWSARDATKFNFFMFRVLQVLNLAFIDAHLQMRCSSGLTELLAVINSTHNSPPLQVPKATAQLLPSLP